MPTYKEQGYDIEAVGWYAFYVPAKTDPKLIQRYSAILKKAVQSEEGKAFIMKLGLTPSGTTPEELAKIQQADFKRFTKILRDGGYQGWVALEYESANPATEIPRRLKQMKELFAAS